LESDWFQTLTLEYQSWFQNVPFKCNLRRYAADIIMVLLFTVFVSLVSIAVFTRVVGPWVQGLGQCS
jgi:hypothetical protein